MNSPFTKDHILNALRQVKGPDQNGNLVDLGLVSEILIQNNKVYFSITVPPEKARELESLRQEAGKIVMALEGVEAVTVTLTADYEAGKAPAQTTRQSQIKEKPGMQHAKSQKNSNKGSPVPGVKYIIAVASGKGGVGKSTTAVNLALGFQANGLKVGLLDADIYGPSVPRLLGISGRPQLNEQDQLTPMQAFGLKAMSMGFMVDEETAMIWRGPMVMSAITQMLKDVAWGQLDMLVVDMPPGTGDAQLTLAQQVPLAGAIIVSTPQDLALIDARKGISMFRKVNVPILGIIENMSYFLCPKCGERSDIFGTGGARKEAEKLNAPFLGEVPLHMDIREKSDAGQPIVVSRPDSSHAQIYKSIASKAWDHLDKHDTAKMMPAPNIVIES